MKIFTFKPLSLAAFALLATGSLAAQNVPGILADAATANPNHLIAEEERWGSSMGDASGITQRTLYFYDNQNRLVRKASYGKDYSTGEYTLSYYYTYNYDENGRLLLTCSRQWGLYDGDEYGFNTARDSVKYTYNDLGQVTRKTEPSTFSDYTYDADGNIATETIYNKATQWVAESVRQTITYSGYVAPNCPTHVESAARSEYLAYKSDRKYNAANQLVYSDKYTETETTGDDGMPVITKNVTARSEYGYDEATGRQLYSVNYSKAFENGDLIPTDSIAYTVDNDDPNRIRETSYTWDSWADTPAWVSYSTYNVGVYRDFDPSVSAKLAVAPVENRLNSNKLTITLPECAAIGGYNFQIYRDGVLIGSVDFADEENFNIDDMTYTFVDNAQKNGQHDYYVVTLASDEMGDNQTMLNCSNLAIVDNYTELPAPTNVHATNYYKNGSDNIVTVAWDAPAYTDEMGFLRYNVMMQNARTADNHEADGQATEWDVNFYTFYDQRTFCVQAVYTLGKVSSESVTIVLNDVISGISQAAADGTAVSFDGTTFHLGAKANLKVFNTAGQAVAAAADASSVSLQALPKGVYVISAENGGKVNAYKVVR